VPAPFCNCSTLQHKIGFLLFVVCPRTREIRPPHEETGLAATNSGRVLPVIPPPPPDPVRALDLRPGRARPPRSRWGLMLRPRTRLGHRRRQPVGLRAKLVDYSWNVAAATTCSRHCIRASSCSTPSTISIVLLLILFLQARMSKRFLIQPSIQSLRT
jgi:hypothetical protein